MKGQIIPLFTAAASILMPISAKSFPDVSYKMESCGLSNSVAIQNIALSPSVSAQFRNTDSKTLGGFIEPFTAVTLATSAAKLLFGFFSSNNGPSVVDFIKNATEQLSIINQKFDIALKDLEDIKRSIDNVPSKVVTELRRNQLKAQIGEYIGILSGVNANAYNGSIKKYMQPPLNKRHIEAFCNSVRETKTQLQALEYDPFSVPFVSMAMNMEYYLRLNFLEETPSAIAGPMSVDKQWLQKCLFEHNSSLLNILISLQQLRKTALYSNTENYTGRYTFSTWDGRYGVNGVKPCGVEVHFGRLLDTTTIEIADIVVLRKIGLLKEEDRPYVLFISSESEIWPNNTQQVNFNADQSNYQTVMNNYKQQQLTSKNNWLSQNYYAIAAIGSAFYAGTKSIELCNVYLSATGLKK